MARNPAWRLNAGRAESSARRYEPWTAVTLGATTRPSRTMALPGTPGCQSSRPAPIAKGVADRFRRGDVFHRQAHGVEDRRRARPDRLRNTVSVPDSTGFPDIGAAAATRRAPATGSSLIGIGNIGGDVSRQLQSSNFRIIFHTPYITSTPTRRPPPTPIQGIICSMFYLLCASPAWRYPLHLNHVRQSDRFVNTRSSGRAFGRTAELPGQRHGIFGRQYRPVRRGNPRLGAWPL